MAKISRGLYLGSLIVVLLSGCERLSDGENYSLATSSTGNVYRLNINTGEIRRVHGSVLVQISETSRIEMVVGSLYVLEDGSQMEYVGSGQFKPFEDDALTLQEYLETIREE